MLKPLTIGVDVRDLRVAKTGTKTYLEELCKEFKKMNSDTICFHFLNSSLPIYVGTNKLLKLIEHIKYQLWKQLILPLKAWHKKCDIVFCTDNIVPLIHLGYQTIPVFHDAFFFETPENYGKLWLWLYKKTALPAAKNSRFVVTPTVYAKRQIQKFTNISEEQLVVAYEGTKTLSSVESNVAPELILESFSLTASNYILHVGSMFKRKNIPALIIAFRKIKQSGYPKLKLVLAGSVPSGRIENDYESILKTIKSTGLTSEVIMTGYLTDQEVGQLYKNAFLYVFPSINEGFGLPLLEAFENNLPVLVSDNTCLPEVGGDAVLTFNPFDTNDIFNAIKTVLDDAELRKEMIRKGQERLKNFSWQNTAYQIVDVFKKANECK